MPFFFFIHRLNEVVCLANFIFCSGGSHSGRARFWGVRWGFFCLRLLGVCLLPVSVVWGVGSVCTLLPYVLVGGTGNIFPPSCIVYVLRRKAS